MLAAILVAFAATYISAVLDRVRLVAPAPTPLLVDRSGRVLAQLSHDSTGRVEHGYWSAAPLPERVVRATLALEDRRFWQHPGVDAVAVLRAAWQDLVSLRRQSGASTVAMQVVRMQNPAPRTFWAKAVEAGAALGLTWRYGRQAVLEQYLRLVPYANGSHGIGHAARYYFDRPVGDLSWAQIALLSAVPQAPTWLNPLRPDGLLRAKARARRALATLRGQEVLSQNEYDNALVELASLSFALRTRRSPDALHVIARLRRLLADPAAPTLDPASPLVAASLDLSIQGRVSALTRTHVSRWQNAGAQQAAVLVVKRAGNEVIAAIGSVGDAGTPGSATDFTRVSRSPGSTLKPFLYAAALQRGLLDPAEMLEDRPEGAAGIGNADGVFLGRMLPRQALANSRNAPAVTILRRVGIPGAFTLLRSLGLHDADQPASSFGLSMAIGSLPTSLERLSRAYGALATDGMLRDLVWFRGQPAPAPARVIGLAAARQVTLFLADPVARLPSFPRYGSTEYAFPVALKTGTSQGYRDAWTVAWSRDWLVAVWMGRPDAAPMSGLSGAQGAASLARDVMLALHDAPAGSLSDGGFPPPPDYRSVALCTDGIGGGACPRTLTEWVPTTWHAQPANPTVSSVGNSAPDSPVQLSIMAPDQNARLWRNPEMPPAQSMLMLRAKVSPDIPEVVWYVDGMPFALARPQDPVPWPMRPGAHRFQLRLPSRPEASSAVRVVIE